jgi:hypothetical protein
MAPCRFYEKRSFGGMPHLQLQISKDPRVRHNVSNWLAVLAEIYIPSQELQATKLKLNDDPAHTVLIREIFPIIQTHFITIDTAFSRAPDFFFLRPV